MSGIAFLAVAVLAGASLAETRDDGATLYRYFAQASAAVDQLEFTQMFRAIRKDGVRMGPTTGWFKPSQCRYDWNWLAARCDADKDGRITPKELRDSRIFTGLDRDRDGAIAAGDFDWSERSPFLRDLQLTRQWLPQWDGDHDQKITRAEWDAIFDKLANGRSEIDAADLIKLTSRPRAPAMNVAAMMKMPTKKLLLERLLTGELGSPFTGPNVGEAAPPFTLKTHDGKQKISLYQYRYQKPVVLIFGSFT